MVFGFPGTTEEYLTSHEVKLIAESTYPIRIKIREQKLAIIDADMKSSDAIRIKYAAKQSRVSNGWKKWIGAVRGLNRMNAVNMKENLEDDFQKWATSEENRLIEYGELMTNFKNLYRQNKDFLITREYFNEAIWGIEVVDFASSMNRLVSVYNRYEKDMNNEEVKKELDRMKRVAKNFFKNYNLNTDKRIFKQLTEIFYNEVDAKYHPEEFSSIQSKYKGDIKKYMEACFGNSFMVDSALVEKHLESFPKSIKKITKDPFYRISDQAIGVYSESLASQLYTFSILRGKYGKQYMKGLREMQTEKQFYPDANSTMRLTYGQVNDYFPRDGVHYTYFTTLDGVMEKYVPGDSEFDLPEKLISLYQTKDYGRYGVNGTLPVCFIATNHTTGGNSGSPVINGKGELIGTNFDRNWEGTMSDIKYDPDMVRNISVDIRYTLFIIDKFAGAKRLINEMKIIQTVNAE